MQVITHPEKVYNALMDIIVKLAQYGVIHGDFNEFNILIDEEENVTVIDFPQMVSVDHPLAKMYAPGLSSPNLTISGTSNVM